MDPVPDTEPDPATAEKNISCFDKKLQFTYPYAFITDIQATGEAFSPQKENALLSIKFNFFLLLWVIFPPLVSGSNPDTYGSGSTTLVEMTNSWQICCRDFFL